MIRREEMKAAATLAELKEAVTDYENGANFAICCGYAGRDFSESAQEIIYTLLKNYLNGGEENG